MYDYYCKNCNNLVGKWDNKYKFYNCIPYYCTYIISKNFNSIFFLDCKKCNKFIGLICNYVCKHCFGKKEIIGEENIFNWFLKYKNIKNSFIDVLFKNPCKSCNINNFRYQFWFFEELTFYK